MAITFTNLSHFAAHAGQSLGETDYLTITQEMVNLFAEATGDHQWIHTDQDRAMRESPYKSTIAHGFLTLSLAPKLLAELYRVESVKMGINYGANKIRFTNAVPVGSRLRMAAQLQQVESQPAGVRATIRCTFYLKDVDKPACIAELVILLLD
ncbi:MaoC family dehydratase [Spirosoma radiotolerans]|uniref:Dehydratase n=1 Tax=Spirosoma radiotolerans TaxID=1379870 RepID=A0A0E4A0B2_9BACT|nr:MaoC family dehydratase [Spirosoma radiotolerans]AKD58084.1 dehydratase [Spirosoma radiotolerans]